MNTSALIISHAITNMGLVAGWSPALLCTLNDSPKSNYKPIDIYEGVELYCVVSFSLEANSSVNEFPVL